MTFISIIIGIVIGVVIFSSMESGLIGCIVGGVIAYLIFNILLLQGRVSTLEANLSRAVKRKQPSPKPESVQLPPKPAERPPEPELEAEPEPEPEIADAIMTRQQSPIPSISQALPSSQPIQTKARIPSATSTAKDQTNPIEWLDIILSYFTGGNVVVKIGIIVLFFGVGFLLKYSIEKNMVPIELRLAGICLGGMMMLIIGWRLRVHKTAYALILQGGGVGILYLTTFTALKLYQLIPIWLALVLLVALPVFSAALAIIQNARSLIVIGIIGGFLAPVLTSTGGGSHVILFSYYALLNFSILLVAWFKSWRELNLIGFVFTFVIGALWGSRSFQPELFASTEPFLVLFFCFYVLLGLLFARNQPLKHKGYIDCTMVFGTPIICFALQSALVRPYEYGLAWSAIGMGIIYITLAWVVFRKGNVPMRTMIESFMALGVVFGTIAIPLALDGRWTAAAWALEGAAVIWIAIRQNRPIARIFGVVLQLFAGFAFLHQIDGPTGGIAVINGFYLGCLAVSVGAFFSSLCLFRNETHIKTAITESRLLFGWALLWWFGAGLHEIDMFVRHYYKPAAILAFWSFSSVSSLMAAAKLCWTDLRHVHKTLFPVMIAAAGYWMLQFQSRPSIYLGYLLWPLTFAVQYRVLYLDREHCERRLLEILHTGTFLLLIFLLSWEAFWWTDLWVRGPGIWPQVILALVPAFFVMLLTHYRDSLPWPVSAYRKSYLYHALGTVVIYLAAGSVLINITSKGNPWPLSYFPFFNSLDLTQILVLIVMFYWFIVMQLHLKILPFTISLRRQIVCSGAVVFFWLNAVLIRTLHYWGKVSFGTHQMLNSELTQTSLSIFWTLFSLVIMKWAIHKMHRSLWMVGAALIGIVVVKLFTIDLVNTGTVERIISFIGVGVLCLVIGYLAPLPGKQEETAT